MILILKAPNEEVNVFIIKNAENAEFGKYLLPSHDTPLHQQTVVHVVGGVLLHSSLFQEMHVPRTKIPSKIEKSDWFLK